MPIEKNDIDQLFFLKLGEYEKKPPLSVWNGIEDQLNSLRRNRLVSGIKAISIAAAIVLALLAGWEMSHSSDKSGVAPEAVAKQLVMKIKKEAVMKLKPANLQDVNVKEGITPVHPPNKNRATVSPVSSKETFAANTSLIGRDGRYSQNPGGQMPAEVPRIKPVNFRQNFKKLDRISTLIEFSLRNEPLKFTKSDSKSANTDSFKEIDFAGSVKSNGATHAKAKNGRWSIRALFAPGFSGQPQNYSQISDFNSTITQNNESPRTIAENSFSGGILFGYKVSKRFNVRSGIVYNAIRKIIQKGGESRLKQHMEYIRIPVQLACKLVDRRFSVGLTGGFNINYLVGNKEVLSSDGNQISSGKTSNLQNLVYSGAIGTEFGYDITKRLAVTVEPRFNHYLNSLSTNNSINSNANQFEIATGLIYSFN